MSKKTSFQLSSEYTKFLETLKKSITKSRNKAILSVNSELIMLYFSIGKDVTIKQKESNWGDNFIGQIEKDIKKDFRGIKGFSRRNILYMRAFYNFVGNDIKMQQLVAQIPWWHIVLVILKRCIVIELKTTEFKPSDIGQLGFYTTAVDRDIKTESDGKTVGLLICKTQDSTVVEYALSNTHNPTGVAEYKLSSDLPGDIDKFLPTTEDFKQLLSVDQENK